MKTLSDSSGYSLSSYGDMVTCEPRMSAYDKALREAITPGCTVIDLGAGPGVFAVLACRYGAGKVIAIEPDRSILLLRQIAIDNGVSDRIEIVHGLSSDYHPSEKADVIVSDLRGALPLFEAHVAVIADARERLLKPGGTLIPARDHLRVAAVEAPDLYAPYDRPWRGNGYDVDLTAGERYVVNTQGRADLKGEALLSSPQLLATLDYSTITDPNLRSQVAIPFERAGTVHGLVLWFDAELGPGATYSNAPGEPPQVYTQTFFPLERPLMVGPGDRLDLEIMANMVDGIYIWTWNTSLHRAGADRAESRFRQSTFHANIFDHRELATRSDQHVPSRPQAVDIDALCLSLIDGERSLRAIADRLEAQFPSAFANSSEALTRAAQVAGRYGGRA